MFRRMVILREFKECGRSVPPDETNIGHFGGSAKNVCRLSNWHTPKQLAILSCDKIVQHVLIVEVQDFLFQLFLGAGLIRIH